ncbi:MAG: hypothetical protein QNJ90_09830 [Planctomycetota bacterium]|nr:hypothetical protein [Planctomycetota bacterium]
MTLRLAPGRTVLLGTALVLALVALQPLALGFFPVGGGDVAVSAGSGDLAAGALSAIVRDLNAEGPSAAHARSVSPVVLLPLRDRDGDAPRFARARNASIPAPASTLAGSSEHGYQLLL